VHLASIAFGDRGYIRSDYAACFGITRRSRTLGGVCVWSSPAVSVDYTARLTAHLPEALQLIMLKADGSLLVHTDAGEGRGGGLRRRALLPADGGRDVLGDRGE
jgi:hypothetical protein